MKRLDGNNVLIIEGDKSYSTKLKNVFKANGAQVQVVTNVKNGVKKLEVYEFDIIICNYYVSDGLIHHVIDWAKENLSLIPIFVAIGSAMAGEEELMHRQLITCKFNKSQDPSILLAGVQEFLFDFKQFYESVSMAEPESISLELVVRTDTLVVAPIEMTAAGIYLSTDNIFDRGTFALLRVRIYEGKVVENFTLLGTLGEKIQGGQQFRINEAYANVWSQLLNKFSEKQISISDFLCKVAGS